MLIIPNCRFIHPLAEELSVNVMPNDDTVVDSDGNIYPLAPSRQANIYQYQALNETVITLPWTPIVKEWTEIYLDGIRIVGFTTDFGIHYNPYTIVGNVITFNDPITGSLTIVCDDSLQPEVRDSNIIPMDNIQGAKVASPQPDHTYAATWCEPLVCAQPYNGYVRLSDDRRSLIYVPRQHFVGYDSFSYALLSQRGQLSKPKCVFLTVEPPTPPSPPSP